MKTELHHKIKTSRVDYTKHQLLEDLIDPNPFIQFQIWLKEVVDSGEKHANAMVLSTVDEQNIPSSRVLLLKDISHEGFTFFTNYNSKKGSDMNTNPHVAMLFFWEELERQVRIEGKVKLLSEPEAKDYFKIRPRESQIAAWVSNQSQIINNRKELDLSFSYFVNLYENRDVPKPPHWGGYVLIPEKMEFWQGRANRLHDRIQYTHKNDQWIIERLAP